MGLLQMSFTGAILILVIVVIRVIAIHRLPKKTFLVLWIIAIARLLLPFSVPSPFSVYSLAKKNEPNFPTSDTVIYENRQPMYHVEMEQIQNNPVVSNTTQTLQTAPHISIWTTIWIIGMLIFAGVFLVSYLRCRREFRAALPIQNFIIAEWLDEHQLKRKIEIRQFSEISTPMTYGVIHPVILLPQNSDWENKQQLQYILFHEYVHICRYDTALKILATIALCIHWFNPMVWVMYILFNRDIELTCDECVVHNFGRENRSVYAKMLISMEEGKNIFAPFCNNFSKNAIEERIESIMKIRKISILTLALACITVIGTVSVFATSVQAGKNNYSITEESTQAVTNNQLFPEQNVEWWTYEEYAQWLENEKKELASIIGEKSWTPSRGEFVWTEEMVKETVQMYEEILEEIKNGALYSKSIDGDAMIMTDYSISEDMVISEDTVVDSMAVEQITDTERFRIYEQFGMTYDVKKNELTFNGKLVRWFEDYYPIDGTNYVGIDYFNENGIVDVYAVRDFSKIERNADGSFDPSGKLVGLKEFSQEEFNSRDINIIKNPEQVTITGYTDETIQDIVQQTEETQILLQDYIPFGLNYEINSATGELSMNWKGKPVHSIFDEEKSVWIANSQRGLYLGSDAVDLEAVYKNGILTGLRDTQNHSSHNSVYVVQEAIAGDPVSDKETDSWLAEYGQFGVTYDKINNQWYFNGEKVRQFRDILTSNGEDLTSGFFHGSIRTLSGNGTVDIYTVRDFSNLNSDGNGTLIDVKAYNQEEFNEHTESNGTLTESP